MILSILICSLDSRAGMLTNLLRHLDNQIKECNAIEDVEVIVNMDNKQKTTGKKRQELLEEATGKYIIFIDDDDWVEDFYISELLQAAQSDADCFAINGCITTNGHNKINWRLSKDNPNSTVKEFDLLTRRWHPVYLRTTNHITAVKREIALLGGFPDKSNAEDKAYSDAINPHLKTEYQIEKPLYHYKFVTYNKEY